MDMKREAEALASAARAAKGKDWPKAAALAAELRERFPAHMVGYEIGAISARVLRRPDEAAALVEKGAALFPAQAWPLAEQAWNARQRGDAEEAWRVTEALRQRFPDNQAGYQIGAASARKLGLHDAAEALLAEAAKRFPALGWPVAELILAAKARGGVDEALHVAAGLRTRFPENPAGYQTAAACAREVGRLDEASEILAESAARFADQGWLVVEEGWLALALGDAVEAGRLAAELRERFPGNPAGYQIGVAAAHGLGRFDEAQAVLELAAERLADPSWVERAVEAGRAARANREKAAAVEALGRS